MRLSEIRRRLFEEIPEVRGICLTFEFDLGEDLRDVRVVVAPYPQTDKTFPASLTLREFKELIDGSR